jgi:hypothetical protein
MATTMKISKGTHARLQQLTLRQSADRGMRLTMEAVLLGLLDLAEAHPDELQPVILVRGEHLPADAPDGTYSSVTCLPRLDDPLYGAGPALRPEQGAVGDGA